MRVKIKELKISQPIRVGTTDVNSTITAKVYNMEFDTKEQIMYINKHGSKEISEFSIHANACYWKRADEVEENKPTINKPTVHSNL